MKKMIKILGSIAVIYTLLITGCPNPESPGVSYSFGENLKISNKQVWTSDFSSSDFSLVNKEFSGDLDISDNRLGGSGKIGKGKLNYTIGVPDNLGPLTLDVIPNPVGEGLFTNFSISPNNVKGTGLVLSIAGDTDEQSLFYGKNNLGFNLNTMSIEGDFDMAIYIYVDKNATISATGSSVKQGGMTFNAGNISLKLKAGWNIISAKSNFTLGISDLTQLIGMGDLEDISDIIKLLNGTIDITVRIGYPSGAKWILGSGFDLLQT